MKSIRNFLFILGILSGMGLSAQQVVIKADTVVGVAGDSVTIPITYKNLNNAGSVTLYLTFNSSLLKWGRALNWEAGFNNGFNLANVSGNTLVVTCINVNGFSSAQGKLADLRFKYMGPTAASLTFTASSEITDINGSLVSPAPQYKNGLVVKELDVTISANPTSICQGTSTQINANASGLFGIYSYQWTSTPGSFSSTQASFTVSPSVTTRYYCTVSHGTYTDTSSVLITVIPVVVPAAVTSMLPAHGATGLNNPVTLSWAPVANATSYDLYWWPASGTQPATPQASNLSGISHNIPGNLTQAATYKWRVISKNPCAQTSGPVYEFTMLALPELHVTQVTLSSAYAGQPIDISWTVKNDGPGATTTPLWYDRVWISPDIEIRLGETDQDKLLGTFPNISYLGPGESYTQTQTVVLPPNLIGTYYIFVITDAIDACLISWPGGTPQLPYSPPPYAFGFDHGGYMVNVVKEVSDNPPYHDNFFYKEINLATPPLPDLKVINILKSSSIFSGQQLTVTWTVLNDGDASGTVSNWSDRIYLSADTLLNTSNAFDLGTFSHSGMLAPDSIYIKSAQVNVPNYIMGNYFIYIYTDIYDGVFEHVYEGNNITRSDTLKTFLTPPPDLVVSTINIPASASGNESVIIKFIVNNQGATATTAPHWIDRVYLSQSSTGDLSTAILLGNVTHSGTLNSFDAYSAQLGCVIPKNITGSWYVYVQADINNNVFEYNNENNNLLRSDGMITVLNPDLNPVGITIPAADSTNAAIQLSWYDKNSGPGKLISQSWMDKLYVSLNAVFDAGSSVLLDSITNNIAINAGDSLIRTINAIIPNVNTGLYYVYVQCDSKNQVFENLMEDNNTAHSVGTLLVKKPDLIVQSLLSGASGESGIALPITVILKNNGAGKVSNKTITDKVYLSATSTFNPLNAITIGTFPHVCDLSSGSTETLNLNPVIPDGINGNYYLVYSTDFTDIVWEGTYENNNIYISPTTISITNGPWADLEPLSLVIPGTAVAGNPLPISFSVSNSGTKATANIAWKDRIYKSASPVWDSTNASLEKTIDRIEPLAMGASYDVSTTINIPVTQGAGMFYYYILTDATNKVFEYTDEDNNVFGPVEVQIAPYPLNLRLDTAGVNIGSAETGQSFQYTYKVSNIGPVNTTANQWYDALFVSLDTILNKSTDILVGKWTRPGTLAPGNSYQLTRTMMIPNGLSGSYYFIGVADLDNVNADVFYANNSHVVKDNMQQNISVGITLTPPPDLVVESFVAPAQTIAGQPFKVHFTIKNQGVGSSGAQWKERLYLSQDFDINSGDIPLGTFSHSGILDVGETYSDSLEVTINQNVNANLVLILKTDVDNDIYEHMNESNNIVTSFLAVAQAPPVDLVIDEVSGPMTGVVGQAAQVNWVVRNLGNNTATGQLKDAVYLSADTILDASDKLWFTYQGPVSIPPMGIANRSVNYLMPGLPLGNYYLIGRTDLVNSVTETNENNNKKPSLAQMTVDFQALTLDVVSLDTLTDIENIYYKLVIPEDLSGETFQLILKGDSINGANEVYASLNKVPNRISYQYKHQSPFEGNQELIIPALSAGNYYFLVTGSTENGNQQNITLLPKILNFEIRSLQVNKGGNLGGTTVLVKGSKFTTDMTISLRQGDDEIEGYDMIFLNASEVIVSFNFFSSGSGYGDLELVPVPYGYYNVIGTKPGGATTKLINGFEVVEALSPVLLTNIQYPASVRSNRFFTMTIQFVNTGNIDIPTPVRTLISKFGAPIGFTAEDLNLNLHDLYLEFIEPGGPPKFLRPGAVSEIKVHCKSTNTLVFKLLD